VEERHPRRGVGPHNGRVQCRHVPNVHDDACAEGANVRSHGVQLPGGGARARGPGELRAEAVLGPRGLGVRGRRRAGLLGVRHPAHAARSGGGHLRSSARVADVSPPNPLSLILPCPCMSPFPGTVKRSRSAWVASSSSICAKPFLKPYSLLLTPSCDITLCARLRRWSRFALMKVQGYVLGANRLCFQWWK
jgi:hypothetical protein